MICVLDASALMAYFEKQYRYQEVENLFSKALTDERKILLSTVNWGELYYLLLKRIGEKQTLEMMQHIENLPLEIVLVDKPLARQAAYYKALHQLPYADGFAAATAKRYGGKLVTADWDFKLVEKEIEIVWINK